MKTTDEETILGQNEMVNEETVVENVNAAKDENKNEISAQKSSWKQNRKWVDVGIGAGTGVAAGIIGTLFTSGTISAEEELAESGEEIATVDDGLTTPVVTDGQLSIAHGVSDSMSFSEAFRVAHEEVGPGGVFEWHGQLYGTYTAAEWNSLSSEERMEYSSHLRVVGTPDYASNVSHQQTHEQHVETTTEDVAVDVTSTHGETHDTSLDNEEVDAVSISNDTTAQTDDMEVEVLGVEYSQTDEGQEFAIGSMSVNGQDVYVVDANNDGIGDAAYIDLNGDGHVDDDEIMDLSDTPVDMSIFENDNSDLSGGMSPTEPDYLPTEGV